MTDQPPKDRLRRRPPVPELSPVARRALRLRPVLRELGDHIQERLPAGVEFGLFLVLPGEADAPGQTIALTTRKRFVAEAVREWYVGVEGGA